MNRSKENRNLVCQLGFPANSMTPKAAENDQVKKEKTPTICAIQVTLRLFLVLSLLGFITGSMIIAVSNRVDRSKIEIDDSTKSQPVFQRVKPWLIASFILDKGMAIFIINFDMRRSIVSVKILHGLLLGLPCLRFSHCRK